MVSWLLIIVDRPIPYVWVGLPQRVLSSLFILVFFSDLHVTLPFDDFTMGVHWTLNVTPSQLHPNTWASLQNFHLICNMFRLSPTPSTFLSNYISHPTNPVSWLLLISQPSNILFSPYTTSYKNFKGKFFKLFVEPKGSRLFFDETGRSNFPLYWTKNPTQFKEWPRSAPRAKELEIYSLFDNLPRRLPTQ